VLGVAAHERQDDVSPLWVVVQECDLLGGVLDDVGVAQHPLPEQLLGGVSHLIGNPN